MKRILASLVLLVPVFLFADSVTAPQAARAARAWVARGCALGRIPADRVVAGVDEARDPVSGARLWIARFEGGGYAVLSADDRVDPVLAFSETGPGLEPDDGNPLWALLCADIAAREAAAGVSRTPARPVRERARTAAERTASVATSAAPTASQLKWAALLSEDGEASGGAVPRRASRNAAAAAVAPSDIRVEPFVSGKWNQFTVDNVPVGGGGRACYNYYTPSNWFCGCVATAGAQLMRYWRWPTDAVPAATRVCSVDGVPVRKTMLGGRYDWAAMPLDPLGEPALADTQCAAIGRLTYDIGVSVGMDWRDGLAGGFSTASLFGLALRLRDTFGYASAVAAGFDASHPLTAETLQRIVIPNCDARAPVAMGIRTHDSIGHVALVDGCGWADGAFCIHINAGSGGIGDAWYVPPDISYGGLDFSVVDQFVFNVFPTTGGSILSGRVLDAAGAPVIGVTVALTGQSDSGQTPTERTAVTDGSGVYAFVVPAGTYRLAAEKDGTAARIAVVVGATQGVDIVDEFGTAVSSLDSTVGNTWMNDIVLVDVGSVPAPLVSPESCSFYPATNVTAFCLDPDATLRYTTDGSEPNEASARYLGPVPVEETATVRFRAFAPDRNPSPVAPAICVYDDANGRRPKGCRFENPIPISGANGSRLVATNSNFVADDPDWFGRVSESGAADCYHTLDEDGLAYDEYRTIWYRWTAPGSGLVTFHATTHYNYSFVAVYAGEEASTARRLAYCSEEDEDEWFRTTLTVPVERGRTYRIAGGVLLDENSDFELSWSGDLDATSDTAPAIVRFDANGGSGTMPVLECDENGGVSLPRNVYWRTGYAFEGWATHPHGTVVYRDRWTGTLELAPGETAVFYAVWRPTTYTIAFNRGEGTGTMLSQVVSQGASVRLPANRFSKTGFLFRGWARSPSGAVVLADGALVTDLAAPGWTVTLHARWKPSVYKVAFNANGGALPKGKKMAVQSMTYGKAAALRKNVFTKKGYVFAGWAKSAANAKKGVIAFANAQSVKNLRADGKTTTLYAVWAKPTYKVAFVANGGTGTMAVQTFKYGKAAKLSANKFKAPKGKKFAGWAKSKTDAKKGKVAYKNKQKVKNLVITGKTVKLYAVWKKK